MLSKLENLVEFMDCLTQGIVYNILRTDSWDEIKWHPQVYYRLLTDAGINPASYELEKKIFRLKNSPFDVRRRDFTARKYKQMVQTEDLFRTFFGENLVYLGLEKCNSAISNKNFQQINYQQKLVDVLRNQVGRKMRFNYSLACQYLAKSGNSVSRRNVLLPKMLIFLANQEEVLEHAGYGYYRLADSGRKRTDNKILKERVLFGQYGYSWN